MKAASWCWNVILCVAGTLSAALLALLCADLLLWYWCWPLATYLLLLIACVSRWPRWWREIMTAGVSALLAAGTHPFASLAMAVAYMASLWPGRAVRNCRLRGRRLSVGLSTVLVGVLTADLFSQRAWSHSRGADFRGAFLVLGDLSGADLRGANLREAHLQWACLKFARLAGADLTGANLNGVCLDGADLTGAVLKGADMTGAHFDRRTRWPVGFSPWAGKRGPYFRLWD